MRHPYAFGVDFWAAAVTLFKMLTGRVCLGLSFIISSNSSRCQVPWYADSAIDVKSIVLYEKLEIDDDEMDHVTKDFMRKVSSYFSCLAIVTHHHAISDAQKATIPTST